MRLRAMTLIEILVTLSLFLVFMFMVCDVMVKAYRVHVQTTTKVSNYRDSTIALARMSRELSTCNLWVSPPIGNPVATMNNSTVANLMQFQRNNAVTGGSASSWVPIGTMGSGSAMTALSGTLCTYWLDVPSQELRALDPVTGGYRVAARGVRDFQLLVGSGSATSPGNGMGTVNVTVLVNDINVPAQMQVCPPMMHM